MKEGKESGEKRRRMIRAVKKHGRDREARRKVKRLDRSSADGAFGSRHRQGQGVAEKRMCCFLRGS